MKIKIKVIENPRLRNCHVSRVQLLKEIGILSYLVGCHFIEQEAIGVSICSET